MSPVISPVPVPLAPRAPADAAVMKPVSMAADDPRAPWLAVAALVMKPVSTAADGPLIVMSPRPDAVKVKLANEAPASPRRPAAAPVVASTPMDDPAVLRVPADAACRAVSASDEVPPMDRTAVAAARIAGVPVLEPAAPCAPLAAASRAGRVDVEVAALPPCPEQVTLSDADELPATP